MIERGGKVIAKPVDKSKLDGKSLAKFVRENIEFADAVLITDEYSGYVKVRSFMRHHSCPN